MRTRQGRCPRTGRRVSDGDRLQRPALFGPRGDLIAAAPRGGEEPEHVEVAVPQHEPLCGTERDLAALLAPAKKDDHLNPLRRTVAHPRADSRSRPDTSATWPPLGATFGPSGRGLACGASRASTCALMYRRDTTGCYTAPIHRTIIGARRRRGRHPVRRPQRTWTRGRAWDAPTCSPSPSSAPSPKSRYHGYEIRKRLGASARPVPGRVATAACTPRSSAWSTEGLIAVDDEGARLGAVTAGPASRTG